MKLKIRDFKLGEEIRSYFCLDSLKKKTSKDGREYLALELSDVSGSVLGFIWDNIDAAEWIRPIAIVELMGVVKSWDGFLILNIKRMRPAWADEMEVSELYDFNRRRY